MGSGAATGVLIRRLTIALVANELQWMKYTLLQTLHQHIKLLKCDGYENGESFRIRLNMAIKYVFNHFCMFENCVLLKRTATVLWKWYKISTLLPQFYNVFSAFML